jgi:diaminopimelate epimerase
MGAEMTTSRFHKMHGLGNDFVIIDARGDLVSLTPQAVRAIADRRSGIGCDQLIILEQVEDATLMRIFNSDGSEVEACGNAARAVGLLLGGEQRIETAGGLIVTSAIDGGASVDMGEPRFEWDAIPLAYPMDTDAMPVGWEMLERPMAVNVGNPHVIFFVDPEADIDLARLGPVIETDPLFPERINVNVARITGPSSLRLDVWERGAGLTRACGTGACATAVAAIKSGRATSPVTVTLPGGDLTIEWQAGSSIRMTGDATYVFAGEADWSRFG